MTGITDSGQPAENQLEPAQIHPELPLEPGPLPAVGSTVRLPNGPWFHVLAHTEGGQLILGKLHHGQANGGGAIYPPEKVLFLRGPEGTTLGRVPGVMDHPGG